MAKEVIFIGGLYPHETYSSILESSKSGFQGAADALQWKIIRGLNGCVGASRVHVINSLYIGSFPRRYSSLLIKDYEFETSPGILNGINTSFLNFPILKEIFRTYSLKRDLKRLVKSLDDSREIIILGYAASLPIVKTLLFAKALKPECQTCLVVPDLPEYMELGQDKASILKQYKNRLVESDMLAVDKFVLLTDAMAGYLGISHDRYCVVEGIADNNVDSSVHNSKQLDCCKDTRILLYTGTLQYKYGIRELIDAIIDLKRDDICLTICGDGEAAEEIRGLAAQHPCIRYLGVVGIDEVKRLQSDADFLINPRNDSDEYTKYSFPSKMMEYLSAGVPVIAYMLPGIPSEYSPYFIHANNKGLKAVIDEALSLDGSYLDSLASSARSFVLENKNPIKQVEKILALMETN